MMERALERGVEILKSHKVEPLEEKLAKEIDMIVEEADRELLG